MENKFNANEWFVEGSNGENIPHNKLEKLEEDTVNTTEKPVVYESYEDYPEEVVVSNNEETPDSPDITVTKKRQGVKFKAWQILSALLAVVIAITSVLVFKRNKPTVAVDDTSTSKSQVEQLPEIIESVSENTQEENSGKTENNEKDTAEADGQTTENNEKTDEQTKNNNVTNKSENAVTTTKKNSISTTNPSKNSNTSTSATTTQASGSNGNTNVKVTSDFTWSLVDGVLTISPKRNDEMVKMENFYGWYDTPWSDQNRSITKVIIKDGIMNIPDNAFEDFHSLTSVTIPNSVKTIGEDAFESCVSLTSITIPNSVTSIGKWAFYYCPRLTGITIPNSVKTIGDGAFDNCISLTSITIPNSVKIIGDYTFDSCFSLTSITIPNSVTTIGEEAFEDCENLTTINYSGTKAQWTAISKGKDWDSGTGKYTVYCSDGSIKKS